MNTYRDGLNYVPLLAAQSAHITNGNRVCLNTPRRCASPRNSVVCYNGNYEGDLSMFGSKQTPQQLAHQRHLELVESDSDTEYKRELETYQPPQQRKGRSQLARLLLYYCDRVVSPARRKQATLYTARLYNNSCYRWLCELTRSACAWTLWLLQLVLFSLLQLTNCSYGCWRSCVLLRNTARRLLWWMTLAKCGDVKLFFMLLIGTPLVFAVAIVGFLLAIYCALRECLSSSNYAKRFRKE